jgi:diaminopimelate decarboxylase
MTGAAHPPTKKLSFVDPATFTPHFAWKKQPRADEHREVVACENVPLTKIANSIGTPAYVYSAAAIDDAQQELHRGLGKLPHTLCFAVKSNGNLAILKRMAKLGNGFDIVSGGELDLLGHIGVPGDRIVFSGVGKTREEIREALCYQTSGKNGRRGILLFNVESEGELEVLLDEAAKDVRRGGRRPAVSIRVNPDVQAGGHPHISTGRYEHKFGLGWEEARRLYLAHATSQSIRWAGISVHIGSQIVKLDPFRRAVRRLRSYVDDLRRHGIALQYLDFGGGLGVRYTKEKTAPREEYARMVARAVRPLGLHLLLEPGRTIVGAAGILLTRVLYLKQNGRKTFVVVDSGMNDLLRPALYGAIHPITKLTRENARETSAVRVDVVGPVCETGDCFLRDWPLGEVVAGDLLGVWVAGAYAMSQASNYNARGRAAEVLVEKEKVRVIRRRENTQDLLRGQIF